MKIPGARRSPFAHQADRRLEVAVKFASRQHAVHIPRAVDLELVDTVVANKLQRHFAEARKVLGTGKGKTSFVRFETMLAAIFQTLFFRLIVSAPRRKPYARLRSIFLRRRREGSESLRKSSAKTPESMRIIPAVVEKKRIQPDSALFHQLAAKGVNDVECGRLIVGVIETYVIPRVVVKKGTIRAGSLAFNVVQEPAPHLARWRYSDDR
jgi:hypothetical protein